MYIGTTTSVYPTLVESYINFGLSLLLCFRVTGPYVTADKQVVGQDLLLRRPRNKNPTSRLSYYHC